MSDFTLRVDPARRLAFLTWYATRPDIRVFRPGVAALLAHEQFKPPFGVISDWRLACDAPDSAFVREFVMHIESARRRGAFLGPWATVVAPTAIASYGMGRMTEILTEIAGFSYSVFTDEQSAIDWVVARMNEATG